MAEKVKSKTVKKARVVQTDHAGIFDLELYLPYLLNRFVTALVDRFVAELKPHKLTLPQFRVIAILHKRGPMRFGALGGLCLIELPTLDRILLQMSESGLILRSRSRIDGRGTVVQLSAKGRTMLEKIAPWAKGLEEQAVASMSAVEATLFKHLLVRACQDIAPIPQAKTPPKKKTLKTKKSLEDRRTLI